MNKLEMLNSFKQRFQENLNPSLKSIKYCQSSDSAILELQFLNEPETKSIDLKFIGGEIVLKSCISDKEATIEPMNNRTVVILSSTVHEVKEIHLDKSFNGFGRYCNSAFLTYKDPREMAPNDSN